MDEGVMISDESGTKMIVSKPSSRFVRNFVDLEFDLSKSTRNVKIMVPNGS